MSPAIDALRAAGYGLERRYDGSHDGSSEGIGRPEYHQSSR